MHRRRNTWALRSAFLGLLLFGCDQSFNPKAALEDRLVVFSVISNDRDIQFVRVNTNYDVSGFDPSENRIEQSLLGADVAIIGPSNAVTFRDTLFARPDTNRYVAPIHAYVGSPFRPEPGRKYDLTVHSVDLGSATATVTLPDRPSISIYPGELAIDRPDQFDPRSYFYLRTTLSPTAKGSLCQLFVDFKVQLDTAWTDGRTEVPFLINVDTLGIWIATYPQLTRVTGNATGITYKNYTYKRTLLRVFEQYPHRKVLFKRVVLRVFQCERGFYDYFNAVNGFRDRVSIRVDEPDYTNVKGGMGVFGAYTLDSLSHNLPDDFSLNAR
jgi:hypothetical protein